MRIGLPLQRFENLDSVNYVFRLTAQALARHHQIVYFPPEYDYCSVERRECLIQEWLETLDAVVCGPDFAVLKARDKMRRKPRIICFLFGLMARGAPNFQAGHRYLNSTDKLVGNCTADLELVNAFFSNASTGLLPFAFDESVFHPLHESERQALRAKLGFGPEDRLLLYSGRMTIEKNVHTVLRIFSVVEQLVPNSHCLLVGHPSDAPFYEFSVYPLSMTNMLNRMIKRLNLRRVRFLGQKDTRELCELYNASDAVINMTLHHDENFGLAQVEAMACGTPVVGTRWGGLMDTVVDGETGVSVRAIVTGFGVKVDWWEAANKIVSLLTDAENAQRLRESCARTAKEKYSGGRYCENLQAILTDCMEQDENATEMLKPTEFALNFWRLTGPGTGQKAPYRRNSQSCAEYQALVRFFAGDPKNSRNGNELAPEQVLCLAAPVIIKGDMLAVNDPIFPLEVSAPEDLIPDVLTIINILKGRPVLTLAELQAAQPGSGPHFDRALKWTIDLGIVLLSGSGNGCIAAGPASAHMAEPLFEIRAIDHDTTDIVFLK